MRRAVENARIVRVEQPSSMVMIAVRGHVSTRNRYGQVSIGILEWWG
jgi:hypothetical protein